ncbi:MAG: hypothetical protein LBQ50_04700 [Planctomycetaceae bacterium]|jgi:hypothetical protein|nr:hypothetical protein [Planctomycetaceae bacterium]
MSIFEDNKILLPIILLVECWRNPNNEVRKSCHWSFGFRLLPTFCIMFLILLNTGCSNKVKIYGTVTFPDGEPVNFGSVCFEGNGKTISGYLNEKGDYFPGELEDGDGIPFGVYKVWLSGTVLSEEIFNKRGEATGKNQYTVRVAEKYTLPATTDLTFEVKRGGSKRFDFTVERPSKTGSKPQR